jgi:hypothetical protein
LELRCNAQSCAELRAALQRSSTNSSEPRCSAAPRRVRSRVATQFHEEGDGNCPLPSSSWGCATTPCFFFLAALRCSIAALFFFFFLLLRYKAAVTFLHGGDFFFCFVIAYALIQ